MTHGETVKKDLGKQQKYYILRKTHYCFLVKFNWQRQSKVAVFASDLSATVSIKLSMLTFLYTAVYCIIFSTYYRISIHRNKHLGHAVGLPLS